MDPLVEHRPAPDAPPLPRPDSARASARRRWRRCSTATGAAAAEPPDRRRRSAGLPQLRAQGEAGDLPVPVRRAVADGPVRPQARCSTGSRGPSCPTRSAMGQRLTGMTSRQDELPGRAEPVPVRPARPERRLASASCCRTPRASPTSSASSSRCTPRRSTTTRPSPSSRPGPSSPGRPSIGAWLAYGLGSENQDLPAFVVLISQGTRQPERPAALRPALGQRLPAVARTRG